ncbi:MAG: polysaccharide deacetylase family protein [Mycobacteriales bacterium]
MRRRVKTGLARLGRDVSPTGLTALIYHRVGGGSPDERDVTTADFAAQVRRLTSAPVIGLDEAVHRLRTGDSTPSVVLTFDDGFRDVYDNAWPLLRDAGLAFTIYVASGYIGQTMHWDGSTAKDTGAPALTWEQLGEMVDSGLCTVGNHTHDHVRPELLDEDQLDRCSDLLERRVGSRPEHFAYTWGVPVPRMDAALRTRFVSAVTGDLGRSQPGTDLLRIRRIPVRGSDPLPFFAAKLRGGLGPERAYGVLVGAAKRAGARA